MKRSDTQLIYDLIIKSGIHPAPHTLTKSELSTLSADPQVREKLFTYLGSDFNLYQEMEMDSPYINTHRDITAAAEMIPLHSHPFFEILYCESGSLQYLIGDKRYSIHGGDIVILPPGVSHRPLFYETFPKPYSRIVLWLSTDYMNEISRLFETSNYNIVDQLFIKNHFIIPADAAGNKSLYKQFLKCLGESEAQSPLWEISLYGTVTQLIVQLSRVLLSPDAVFPAEKEEEIDKIISYIEKNYSTAITLESAASEFHISTSTLGKLFTKKLGVSFYHYVTQRRLINAKIKIEEGNSMEEVALACGFCDYSAFYRAFKKEFGITPKEYRKLVT